MICQCSICPYICHDHMPECPMIIDHKQHKQASIYQGRTESHKTSLSNKAQLHEELGPEGQVQLP